MLLLLLQLGECSKDVTLYELGSQSRTCAPLFGASVRPVGCVAATPTSLLGGECFGHKFVLCIGTYATTDGVEDILRERQRERERKREAGQPVIRQSTSAISCSRSLRLHNVRVTEQTNCLTKRANNPEQFSVLSECVCVCICVCEWAQRSIEIAVAASWIAATNSTKRCFCPAQDLFKAMTNAGDTSPFSLALALCLSLYLSPPLSLFLFLSFFMQITAAHSIANCHVKWGGNCFLCHIESNLLRKLGPLSCSRRLSVLDSKEGFKSCGGGNAIIGLLAAWLPSSIWQSLWKRDSAGGLSDCLSVALLIAD